MAGYRKIDPRIWHDAKFRELSDDAKLLFLRILTHPDLTCLGAMRATVSSLAFPTPSRTPSKTSSQTPSSTPSLKAWCANRVRTCAFELKTLVHFDEHEEILCVNNYLRYNPPLSANHVRKAWEQAFDRLPEGAGKQLVARKCLEFLETASDAVRNAVPDAVKNALKDAVSNAVFDSEAEAEAVFLRTPIAPLNAQVCDDVFPDDEHSAHTQDAHTGTPPTGLPQRAHRGEDSFPKLWDNYPRKTNKLRAQLCWARLTKAEREAALEALPAHVSFWQQNGSGEQHIPHASTWLNAKRWEDKLPNPNFGITEGWDQTLKRLADRQQARARGEAL